MTPTPEAAPRTPPASILTADRGLLQHLPDPLLAVDVAGTVLVASPAWRDLIGREPADIEGRPCRELFGDAAWEPLRRLVRQLLAEPGRSACCDVVLLTPDERELVLEVNGVASGGGELPTLVWLSVRDVTIRRGTENDLRAFLFDITPQLSVAREREELLAREKEARAQAEAAEQRAEFLAELGSLLDASLDYRATLTNVARLVVPALADYCLIDEATEDHGTRRVAFAHVDPESEKILLRNESTPPDADLERHPVLRVIRSGAPVLVPTATAELLERIAHDAEHLEKLRRLDVRGFIIVPLVARGRILGALTLVSSISGRQFTEQDVELAEAVARRSALAIDNARLYSRAQEALRTRDEVLAFVSHDLRNPLATILLNASALLEMGADDRLLPSQREQLEWIAHSSEQMNRLIQDLLDVRRAEGGRVPLEVRDVDPADVVWEAALLLQAIARQKGVNMAVEELPSGITVRMDRERILRVLSNLVGNAIKFTPSGGEVGLGGRIVGGELHFLVRDTGVGIPLEDQERVFHGFRHPAAAGGTGLGLTIARRIVEAHGGRIWLRSQPGVGSTFWFALPLGKREPFTGQG